MTRFQDRSMKTPIEMHPTSSIAFIRKKESILKQLAVPSDTYDDLSPKGSVDAEIRAFVDEINSYEGLVTTSSCSGRISVFLEGQKDNNLAPVGSEVHTTQSLAGVQQDINDDERLSTVAYASKGGKGGGGRWLFVSHNPVDEYAGSCTELLNLSPSSTQEPPLLDLTNHRLIHFKFEPMILHILASTSRIAQQVLSAALESGFRESGATTIPSSTSRQVNASIPLAIRTTGLAFDNIIGFGCASPTTCATEDEILEAMVPESYLKSLMLIANEKFRINRSRTERFRRLLAETFASHRGGENEWEDADLRRERKRAEGLHRREELRQKKGSDHESTNTTTDDGHHSGIEKAGGFGLMDE